MRISDWSSDVCSSDLIAVRGNQRNAFLYGDMQGHGALSQASQSLHGVGADGQYAKLADACHGGLHTLPPDLTGMPTVADHHALVRLAAGLQPAAFIGMTQLSPVQNRSEESSVGKEGASTCRYRGSPVP